MSARSLRNNIGSVCIWIAILATTISVGGNLFQMMVVDPLWSVAPPASVQAYFSDARHFEALRRFHQNPFFFVGLLCLVASIALYWKTRALRWWLLIALFAKVAVSVGTTLYVYPINDVLMVHHAANINPASAVELTRHWLFADRVRFLIKVVGLLSLLRALQLSGMAQKA